LSLAIEEPMTEQLSLADRSWPVLGRLIRVHTALYRATGGRIGHRVPGSPLILLLDHVGARTGTRRTTPLAYMPSEQPGLGPQPARPSGH
jgi:hypothetical protein